MDNNNFIKCAEDTAAPGNDLANVSGIAYSGNAIAQYWAKNKLVIDLSGMEIAAQIPLLYNHNNDPEYRLGEVKAEIRSGMLGITGGVDTATERGRFIVEAGKKFQWQLSVGAEISAIVEIPEGEIRTINGREFTGPFYHVKKSQLREVSVCAVGADPETSLNIAASLNLTNIPKNQNNIFPEETKIMEAKLTKETTNETEIKAVETAVAPAAGLTAEQVTAIVENQLKAKANAEAERVAGIRAACGTEFATFAADAITAGYSVQETAHIVSALKAHYAKTPAAGPNVIVPTTPQITAKALEAAICFNQGICESTILSSYNEQEVEAGNKYRGITLRGLLELCAKMEGKNISCTFDNSTIAAAFSTVSLPGILSNVANKKLLQSFTAQNTIATRLCRAGDLSDFKESERYRLTDMGDLELIPDGGEIKHGGLTEDKATNKLETYGKMFVLTRQMIYNDDLNAFLTIPAGMGQRAARKIDQLFHARLLANPTFSDGNALFSAAHGNYTTGTAGALSLESLKAARAKFLKAKDSDGQPINVLPKFLFVPSELDGLANELVISPTVVGGSSVTPSFNVLSKYGLEVISSPYLDNASTTGWYLFGDPNQIDTFEIGYLQGRRVPVVEQGEINFNTLGIAFRVVYDLGIREQSYQGMTFNTGVN